MLKQTQLDYGLCSALRLVENFPEKRDFCGHFLPAFQKKKIFLKEQGFTELQK